MPLLPDLSGFPLSLSTSFPSLPQSQPQKFPNLRQTWSWSDLKPPIRNFPTEKRGTVQQRRDSRKSILRLDKETKSKGRAWTLSDWNKQLPWESAKTSHTSHQICSFKGPRRHRERERNEERQKKRKKYRKKEEERENNIKQRIHAWTMPATCAQMVRKSILHIFLANWM